MKSRKNFKKVIGLTIIFTMLFTSINLPCRSVNADVNTVNSNQKIIGYYPSWAANNIETQIQFDKLTHINYAFLIPNSNGSCQPIENEPMMMNIINKAHEKGVKVLISVGGWSFNGIPLQSTFEALASNETTRNLFVKNVVDFVNKYNLDGADIDWEYPTSSTAGNFEKLMLSLRAELDKSGKLLTAAVTAGVTPSGEDSGNGVGVSSNVINAVDWLNVMAYDGGNGADHSPYSFAENSVNYWINTKKVPKEKLNLGVPFYARPSWSAYNTIVAKDPQAPNKDQSGGDYYNGIETMKKKATLAKEKAGGVMIWELSQDTTDGTSLLNAIHSVLQVSGEQSNKIPLGCNLSHDNSDKDGNYTVTINIPKDNKAKKLELLENGLKVDEYLLDGLNEIQINKNFSSKLEGKYKYTAITSNEYGNKISNEILVTVAGKLDPASKGTKVVGYVTDWKNDNIDEQIQFDKLTHINYAFLIPNTDGSVLSISQPNRLNEVINKAHKTNVKVLISVGGWESNGKVLDSVFAECASNDISREKLVDNIVKFVDEYNLDGADIDWEYPDEGIEADNFEKLMLSLNTKLKAKDKLLTAAVTAGASPWVSGPSWASRGIKSSIFPLVDWLNIMAYDGGAGQEHSPYTFAEDSLKVWAEKGLTKEKMVLGVPFYSRPGWKDYKDLVASDPDAPNKDQSGQEYYNGIDTIKRKTTLALEKGTGIMIWELSQDTTDDDTSLLSAINKVTGNLHNGNENYDKADFNKDGIVDSLDLTLAANMYNVQSKDANWNVVYDLNNDNIVDIYDLVMVATKIA